MTHIWEHSPYKGATLMIHLALADNANDAGECWPHLPTILRKARCSRASGYEALRRMQSDGLLKYEGDEVCHPSRDCPLILLPVQNLDAAVQDLDGPVQNLDAKADHSSSIGTVNEPSSNRVTDVTPVTSFDAFWEGYPKKVGKGAARAAYARAARKVAENVLLAACCDYAALRAGKEKQFTLNPATWLNQERWEDDNLGNGGEWVDPLGVETPGAPDWYLAKKGKP